jgi:hypothetical protein
MISKEIDVGIYKIRVTVYRTGNIHICFVDRMTGEEKILVARNPLVLHKKVDSIEYLV